MASEDEQRYEEVQKVIDQIDGLGTGTSATERAKRLSQLLDEWPEQHAKIRAMRQAAVTEMRDSGMSLRAIAAELGISFGRVHQIIGGVTKAPPKKTGKGPVENSAE